MKSIIYSLLIMCLLSAVVVAQSKVGTTAAPFLQISPGPRGQSMGEAGVAQGDDVAALFWNPALGAGLNSNQAYFSHISWFAGIDLNYGGVLFNSGNWGNFGASFFIMNSGNIEVTTEERPEGTGDLYDVQDMVVGLSYSRMLTDRFAIGGTFKMIRSSIWNLSASTFALDVGLTYHTPLQPLVLGLSITNFGGEMRMWGTDNAIRFDPDPRVNGNNDGIVAYQMTHAWDLPACFRFGFSWTVWQTANHQLLMNSELLYPNNNENFVNMGMEYGLNRIWFLRAGYRQIFLADREGGLSLGAGLKFKNVCFDYAFTDRNRLNSVQYVALGVSF